MKIFEDYFPRVIYLVDFRDVTAVFSDESVLTLSFRAFSSDLSWDWPPFCPNASCKNKKISIPLDLLQKVLEVFDYLLPAA